MSYTPNVVLDFGRYSSSGTLANITNGDAAVFTAQALTTGAPVGDLLVFGKSGLWQVTAEVDSTTNDVSLETLMVVDGFAWTEFVDLPPNSPTVQMAHVSATFTVPVDLGAHPGASIQVYWGYTDAAPTVGDIGLVLTLVRLSDLPAVTA